MAYFHNKRVMVTGGAGFLGRAVVELLQREPCQQIIVPRKSEYDLVQMQDVQRLYRETRPDVVIHLAAAVGGIGANMANPGSFFYENLMMGVQMMEVGRQKNIEKFVAVGTVCSYPKLIRMPFQEDDFWNGYPEETNAPYGLAKKMLSVQSQAYRAQYQFNSIFLLPANLYGPRDNFDEQTSHVIPALIRKCLHARRNNAQSITIWGTGAATREFLYVTDAAKAIVLATEKYDDSHPLNLGTGKDIQIKELVDIIRQQVGYDGEVRWDHDMPDGQPRRCLNVRAMKTILGFTPSISLEDGLMETIQWYEKHSLTNSCECVS